MGGAGHSFQDFHLVAFLSIHFSALSKGEEYRFASENI